MVYAILRNVMSDVYGRVLDGVDRVYAIAHSSIYVFFRSLLPRVDNSCTQETHTTSSAQQNKHTHDCNSMAVSLECLIHHVLNQLSSEPVRE